MGVIWERRCSIALIAARNWGCITSDLGSGILVENLNVIESYVTGWRRVKLNVAKKLKGMAIIAMEGEI